MGYMRGLTHTFGVRRSDKAHRRVGLRPIDPVTFLDRGGRACHIKSDRDVGLLLRLSSEPPLECGDPGSRTSQPFSGCRGDNTRQTQTSIIRRVGKPETPVHSSLTTMFVVSVQDTRPNSPGRMGIIRPTGRAHDGSSPTRGTSVWLTGT